LSDYLNIGPSSSRSAHKVALAITSSFHLTIRLVQPVEARTFIESEGLGN